MKEEANRGQKGRKVLKGQESQYDHYIDDIEEWQENQYNPGYYLGGKIPGNLLYSKRPKMIGAFLLLIGLMTLILFALGIIESFRSGASKTAIDYALLTAQLLAVGGFSALLIVNGIRKIFGRAK
ncbi:MAG TPA: hypothetical protein PKA19_07055 [Bacillota bacterium]|nr:hypothetical protein [Bacillota bacterium]